MLDVLVLIGRILVGVAIPGVMHYYVWRRLVQRAELPQRWHVGITVAMCALLVSIPVTTWLRYVAPGLSNALVWIAMPWMALTAFTFLVLVIMDAGRLTIWLGRKAARRPIPEVSMSRSDSSRDSPAAPRSRWAARAWRTA